MFSSELRTITEALLEHSLKPKLHYGIVLKAPQAAANYWGLEVGEPYVTSHESTKVHLIPFPGFPSVCDKLTVSVASTLTQVMPNMIQ